MLGWILPDDPERLTFRPMFRMGLNLLDAPKRLLYRELRELPPNHLRCRVGAGSKARPWANEIAFVQQGYHFWLYFFAQNLCSLDADVVEMGCGCGRNAYTLKKFELYRKRFSGSYVGIDIDTEALAWCRKNLADNRFTFATSPHASRFYNRLNGDNGPTQLDLDDSSRDFVFATAVFSHLLEAEVRTYLTEAARILRSGGRLFFNFRCLEDLPRPFHVQFQPTETSAHVIDPQKPEKNVAYRRDDMQGFLNDSGFQDAIFTNQDPLNCGVHAVKR
jgi:SAM-dependent methyltransferase